jgi:Protein of unknown function (DUF3237)
MANRGKLMPEIKTEFLFKIDLDFEISVLGDTSYGVRRIARLNAGSFEGPKLKGIVLPGGRLDACAPRWRFRHRGAVDPRDQRQASNLYALEGPSPRSERRY